MAVGLVELYYKCFVVHSVLSSICLLNSNFIAKSIDKQGLNFDIIIKMKPEIGRTVSRVSATGSYCSSSLYGSLCLPSNQF